MPPPELVLETRTERAERSKRFVDSATLVGDSPARDRPSQYLLPEPEETPQPEDRTAVRARVTLLKDGARQDARLSTSTVEALKLLFPVQQSLGVTTINIDPTRQPQKSTTVGTPPQSPHGGFDGPEDTTPEKSPGTPPRAVISQNADGSVAVNPTFGSPTYLDCEEYVESIRRVKLRDQPDGGDVVASLEPGARMLVLSRGRNPKTGQPRLHVSVVSDETEQMVEGWASVHSRDGKQLLKQVYTFDDGEVPEGIPPLSSSQSCRRSFDADAVAFTPRLRASCGPSDMLALAGLNLDDGVKKTGWLVKRGHARKNWKVSSRAGHTISCRLQTCSTHSMARQTKWQLHSPVAAGAGRGVGSCSIGLNCAITSLTLTRVRGRKA